MTQQGPAEQYIDDLVWQISEAARDREDALERAAGAQAALDLAATRWDNTRGYVADLLGSTQASMEALQMKEGTAWACLQAGVAVLEAVASFMDGQHDGSVTRG